ncbi:MAG TPA: protein phosphatase CheZ [Burkholderiaceae bacterium]|nr:protein phosphatase CheZ [Burkholderiaceae bacterium]
MDDAVDLDALFDEISAAQHNGGACAPPAGSEASAAPVVETVVASTDSTAPAEASQLENAADKGMYERLGGIVRLLHDSLRELGYDRSLSDVASQITDAKGRLEYVATLTEQAANKVLNAIDEGIPLQEDLARRSREIGERWQALYAGSLGIDEFKQLASDSRAFTVTVTDAAEASKARLLEIMMAQDFQDITGQLIKKIVTITHTAERELAQLLRDNAPAELLAAQAETTARPTELMQGPSTPGTAMAQDGVDNLLESLGF